MSLFQVPDLHCESCVRAVTGAIRTLDGSATIQADAGTKQVRVESTASDAAVAEAIRDAGFTVEPA